MLRVFKIGKLFETVKDKKRVSVLPYVFHLIVINGEHNKVFKFDTCCGNFMYVAFCLLTQGMV